MSKDMRILKFEMFVGDLVEDIKPQYIDRFVRIVFTPLMERRSSILLTIYDYDQVNDYAKIIIDQTRYLEYFLEDWKYIKEPRAFKDCVTRFEAAKILVNSLRKNKRLSYDFIFWAMMILTVDKTNYEEKLSLICDFSRILKIFDEEIEDILQ